MLVRKNPYLFRAKNINTSESLIRSLLDAHLSSQEETIFGEFLEELAIFICSQVYNGKKSTAEGIDLEFEKENKKFLVSIKSGPNWGNSQQIKKMRANFRQAKRILGQSKSVKHIICVNGCCYGIDDNPDKGDYLKLCGERFWKLMSNDADLYTELIEPLGHKAKEKNQTFSDEYAKVVNKFTIEFSKDFCKADGSISWKQLIAYNSGKRHRLELEY